MQTRLLAIFIIVSLMVLAGQSQTAQSKEGEKWQVWKQFLPHWGNWIRSENPEDFDIGIDQALRYDNKPCAYMKSNVPHPSGFASIDQAFSAKQFRDKHVRFSASVKTSNVAEWSGLWMKVDGADGVMAFDDMKDRPIKGSADWKRYEIVLEVRPDSNKITIGYMLTGGGQVWLNNMKVEAVGKDVAVTGHPVAGSSKLADLPEMPVNLDFSEKPSGTGK